MVLFREMVERPGNETFCSDAVLVKRCLEGDQDAWAQLIARYQRLIYSVARTLLLDPNDIADVFQGACLDLYQGLGELRDVQALPAWLMTVTRRRVAALLRSKANAPHVELESVKVRNTLQAIEHEHAVETALERVSSRCRDLIEMLYFNTQEPSYAEISEKLGIPVASIGPTRARCLEKLRKLLV
jgi:RNA polymerase sigma factor (sigma-70 family)